MKYSGLLMGVVMIAILAWPGVAVAGEEVEDEVAQEELDQPEESDQERGSSLLPLRPGMALKSGGGFYRSVPCQCVDRHLWTTQLVARMHLGWRATIEADLQFGSMLLGGRFPSEGWALGGRVALMEPQGRWWDGLHVRAGYRQWRVMGMRAEGSPGGYGALNWELEVFRHFYIEADAVVGRTFQAMQHWYLMGTAGVSTRF